MIRRIIDLSGPMLVNTKVHESLIDRIAGDEAKIRVNAFPDEELTGVVVSTAPLPDPANFFNQGSRSTPPRSASIEPRRPSPGHDGPGGHPRPQTRQRAQRARCRRCFTMMARTMWP